MVWRRRSFVSDLMPWFSTHIRSGKTSETHPVHALRQVVELPAVAYIPNWLVQSRIVRTWRYHAGGTMLVRRPPRRSAFAAPLRGSDS